MSASAYGKYIRQNKSFDRDIPVMFKTTQGTYVLKVLEVSDNDNVARWAKLGPPVQGMVADKDYY